MADALLLINSKSGVERCKDSIVASAVKLFESQGRQFEIEYTKAPGDAEKLSHEAAARGIPLVVVVGGDGTVRDAANALWGSDTVLGIIPLGSGNGLARSLGIPQDPIKAIEVATSGHATAIDRGKANGNPFYSAFGVGFDAEVSYKFSLDSRRGRTMYIKHALKEVLKYEPKHFKINFGENEVETDAMLIAVCNCRQYGNNAYIAPMADPTDGNLDVTVLHSGNFFAKVVAGIDLFSGTLDRNRLVGVFRFTEGVITMTEEGWMHLDGEPMEAPKEIRIECEKGGLKVAVPKDREEFRRVISPMKSIFSDFLADIKKNIEKGLHG